tara:strand:- start:2316 stop:3137 length:822 start_codon:yes stop_codon:yes gene_type:complete
MTSPLVEVQSLSKSFTGSGPFWRRRDVRALVNVDLEIRAGETVGIVGESGSGKSTLLRIILRLMRPTSGRVLIEGHDINLLARRDLRLMRRSVQAVFQDPTASFNPRQSIGAALAAPLEVHGVGNSVSRAEKVQETLDLVGLNGSFVERYPHQLSGGQRQRASIARAIMLRPKLLLADEPTSALDVSVQAQILNLFKKTKSELGLTCLFVSHNLGVIRYVSDKVAVMYQGQIVEWGDSEAVFSNPRHEYTQTLLAAVPEANPHNRSKGPSLVS